MHLIQWKPSAGLLDQIQSFAPIEQGKTYIYCLVESNTKQPRYVGTTTHPVQRLKDHCKGLTSNATYREWLDDLRQRDARVTMCILTEVSDSQNRTDVEQYYIAKFLRAGHPLLNGVIRKDYAKGYR